MSKDLLLNNKPHFEKERRCLQNSLGITNFDYLKSVEATIACIGLTSLSQYPHRGKFDFNHLKSIHRTCFVDIYPWAGQVRAKDMHIGETDFTPAHLLEETSHEIFDKLAQEQDLQSLEPHDFSERAGYYLGEINKLHPFITGNGRTQRAFMSQLAERNGYGISWQDISREEMIEASIEACEGNHRSLSTLIEAHLLDKDRAFAYKLAQTSIHNKGHDFNFNLDMKHAESGQVYRGTIIGQTGRYIIQHQKDRPQEVVLHNIKSLIPQLDEEHSSQFMDLEISYPHGNVGLLRYINIQKELSQHSKETQEKDFSSDKTDFDYER